MSTAVCESSTEDDVDWSIYDRFHHYDFENDKSFKHGLQKVKELPSFTEADILKAKIFYFTKSFQPVNFTDYSKWLQRKTGKTKIIEKNTEDSSREEDLAEDAVSKQREVTVSISNAGNEDCEKLDISSSRNNDASASTLTNLQNREEHSKGDKSTDLSDKLETLLSLADVAEFIEKGVPLPGIQDLDIKPLEIDPQPSTLQRKTKPWEQ